MRIDTLGVQAFVAIAEQGSFRKAADALHLTQTALTRRLQNLESLLGVKLIERTTRSVAVTRVGRDFLPQGRRLLAELAAALVEIKETGKALRGDVTIACVPTAGIQYLPRIIQEYSKRCPRNRIRILDHTAEGVVGAVLRREAEFGIGFGASQHPDLRGVPLLTDRYVLVCRKDHAFAKRTRLAWSDLAPHPLIFAGEGSSNRPVLDAALGAPAVPLRPIYEVQRSSTAISLVNEGVAAAIVPGLAIQRGAYPDLRVVPLNEPVVSRTLMLFSRKSAHLSPAAKTMYELIAARGHR